LAFDLSAAFDTVSTAQLIPKLGALGINGRALEWFGHYLSGGRQAVVWESSTSDFIQINHGVRQGSLLGPLLFLVLVSDMPRYVGDMALTSYADDTCLWASAPSIDALKLALEDRAARFADYVAGCGLVLNGAKTQFLLPSSRLTRQVDSNFTVTVNGSQVRPANQLELLGITYDRDLSTRPQQMKMDVAARQRATLIARLALHLPRGKYLHQLAHGLLLGKVGYATPIYARPRLDNADRPRAAALLSVQVAINDVARSITGSKRDDRIRIERLLGQAKIPSLNSISIRATAQICWAAFHSNDGPLGDRNPLGLTMFGSNKNNDDDDDFNNVRATRSTSNGEITIPLRGLDTFVVHAARVWNSSPELRMAASSASATSIAYKLSDTVIK
jgi:hypothetical protein